jgi:hypothetical protein
MCQHSNADSTTWRTMLLCCCQHHSAHHPLASALPSCPGGMALPQQMLHNAMPQGLPMHRWGAMTPPAKHTTQRSRARKAVQQDRALEVFSAQTLSRLRRPGASSAQTLFTPWTVTFYLLLTGSIASNCWCAKPDAKLPAMSGHHPPGLLTQDPPTPTPRDTLTASGTVPEGLWPQHACIL